jgi:hypothetical protein
MHMLLPMEITLPFSYMVGWLNAMGFFINLAQYAYDTTQEQMKRSKMSSFFSKGNCVPQLHIQSK